ncbi:MAG TPA: hypothetical protein VGK88_05790 [bacterium]
MSKQSAGAREQPRARSGTYLWIAFGLLAVAVFAGIIISAAGRGTQHPAVGEHWHAQYAVVICGKALPPFRPSAGGIHTHGDGLIHIHPENRSEAGPNATLGRFLASVGASLSSTALHLPGGTTYANGDKCPDGTTGTLHLLVNGKRNEAFDKYVMHDRDRVVIEFH